jgi:hypothetical protein
MRITSPIEDGKVLCGEKGVWMNVEDCFHCPALVSVKDKGSRQVVVCKTAVDHGLWSPSQSTSGLRI